MGLTSHTDCGSLTCLSHCTSFTCRLLCRYDPRTVAALSPESIFGDRHELYQSTTYSSLNFPLHSSTLARSSSFANHLETT